MYAATSRGRFFRGSRVPTASTKPALAQSSSSLMAGSAAQGRHLERHRRLFRGGWEALAQRVRRGLRYAEQPRRAQQSCAERRPILRERLTVGAHVTVKDDEIVDNRDRPHTEEWRGEVGVDDTKRRTP